MTELLGNTLPEELHTIVIKRAVPADAEAMMHLKRAAWMQTYVNEERGITKEDIEKKFPIGSLPEATKNWKIGLAGEATQNERATFVAKVDDRVVGYTSPQRQDGQKRIGALYVSPDYQGKGIGSDLLLQAIAWHGRDGDIYLRVVSYNQNAIRFYERNGFQKTGTIFPEEFDKAQGIKLLSEIEMALPALSKK